MTSILVCISVQLILFFVTMYFYTVIFDQFNVSLLYKNITSLSNKNHYEPRTELVNSSALKEMPLNQDRTPQNVFTNISRYVLQHKHI